MHIYLYIYIYIYNVIIIIYNYIVTQIQFIFPKTLQFFYIVGKISMQFIAILFFCVYDKKNIFNENICLRLLSKIIISYIFVNIFISKYFYDINITEIILN